MTWVKCNCDCRSCNYCPVHGIHKKIESSEDEIKTFGDRSIDIIKAYLWREGWRSFRIYQNMPRFQPGKYFAIPNEEISWACDDARNFPQILLDMQRSKIID